MTCNDQDRALGTVMGLFAVPAISYECTILLSEQLHTVRHSPSMIAIASSCNKQIGEFTQIFAWIRLTRLTSPDTKEW